MAKRAESWVVTDAFWERVEPLIAQRVVPAGKIYRRKPGAGRPPKPARLVFEAIVYVLRTGCPWKALPKERFGSARAVHKRFLEWEKAGFFEALWKVGLAEYDDMQGIAWRWQSVGTAMMMAPLAQQSVGPNPTDRGKNGSKRHLLVDGRGVPLLLTVTGANVHDGKRLDAVLSAIMVERKRPPARCRKHLCADAGYRRGDNARTIEKHGYIPASWSVPSKRTASGATRERRPGAGLSRFAIVGLSDCASYSCATKSSSAAFLLSTISPQPPSLSENCRRRSTLLRITS